MPLPTGTYRLGVTLGFDLQPGAAPILVDLDTSPRAIVHLIAAAPDVGLTTGMTQAITVPTLPSVVTVSGQVTDALGQPVANAAVMAMTSTLVGISQATRFFATAQTQDDGAYTLPVFSGTSYAIMACPPRPVHRLTPTAASTPPLR